VTAPAASGPITLAELSRIGIDRLGKVGPKRVASFASFGISTVNDLLAHYPRRWIDRTKEAQIADAPEGVDSLVIGEIRQVSAPPARGRGPRRVVAVIGDGSGRMSLVFFNQAWRERQLQPGTFVAVFGKVTRWQGTRQMTNPQVDVLGDPSAKPRPIVPIYPQSEKVDLPSWAVLQAVEEALGRCTARGIADPLPAEMRARFGLTDRQSALFGIHTPETMGQKETARRRLAFDELLRVQLLLVMRKRALERDSLGIRHDVSGELVRRFHAALGFELTPDQVRTIDEITADMAGAQPMHRLLQGDVGAGKTVVAVSALLHAVQGGHQGALMAPTEVLADQHAVGVKRLLQGVTVPDPGNLFGDRPLRVELLTNKVTGAERREILAALADGGVDIVIGTHALIQEGVQFRHLGAVVVDEQHRFGVEQRAMLRAKGETDNPDGTVPDVLVMTATPIPRTAAMTVYGDLDVSVIAAKPTNRQRIRTRHAAGPLLEQQVWADVRDEVAAGRQAYVVCPLIEESEKLEVASATETYERLAHDELRGLRLGLLHGRMPSAEKEAVMEAFRRRDLDVLVATTVIEVGVDVPNATVMVILDADRFGIAQLHQLRGRVGRGEHRSLCWLVTAATDDPASLTPSARVQALVDSDDGFELSEVDLDLRGEGTIMSTAQKGKNDLKLASLRRDRELVALARDAAFELVDADPAADLSSHPALRSELDLFLSPEDEEFLFKS
jgi:ATP-dependent DNA helicase RecG